MIEKYKGYCIEYIETRGDYRVYDPIHPSQSIAYVDSIEEAKQGIDEQLAIGPVHPEQQMGGGWPVQHAEHPAVTGEPGKIGLRPGLIGQAVDGEGLRRLIMQGHGGPSLRFGYLHYTSFFAGWKERGKPKQEADSLRRFDNRDTIKKCLRYKTAASQRAEGKRNHEDSYSGHSE